jgi:hypothetical protein
MATKAAYKAQVDLDITDKTAEYSITPTNVGENIKDLVDNVPFLSENNTFTGTITASNLSGTNTGDVVPAALTKTNDTNVTLTLGGSPTTSVLAATSLTLGWTGQLSIARGGTGLSALGSTLQLLRVNAAGTALEYFTAPYVSSAITSLNGLTGAVQTLATGVTGSDFNISSSGTAHTFNIPNSSPSSRGLLGSADYSTFLAKQDAITGGASTITSSNLTVSRALASDGSGKVAVSATTATELGYVSGVTSAIQTQLNAKQATITGGATTIVSSNLTASKALVSDGSGKVAAATTTSTEIGYVNGVTSAIQTQLDSKAPLASPSLTGTPLSTTAAFGTNTTQIATTAFVQQELSSPFNRQTASYTLVLADRNKCVEMNLAGANNLTVPPNSSVAFPINTEITIFQYGAGQTTIVAGAGVTLRSKSGQLKIGNQYTAVTLKKVGTDEWYVIGNVSA